MKYIVVKHEHYNNIEKIYLFPRAEQHKDFVAKISKEWMPIRAGFVCLFDKIRCFGESFSLGLRSDSEKDTALLQRELDAA